MIMNFREQYEANKELVQLKATSNPDLFVLKYRRVVFFKGLWNDFLEEARGTIVDKDFNIVSRPFRKIYNFGIEAKAPQIADHEEVTWFRKVNGFMVAMTWFNDEVLVSTTGSIDSDFVTLAKKYITPKLSEMVKRFSGLTLMFECCDPSDPHIVEEASGLYLIGIRSHDGELKTNVLSEYGGAVASNMGVKFPEQGCCTMGEMRKMAKNAKHEGFVFYTNDGRSAKIKSPHYLVKKLFMRGNIDKLFDKNIKATIDEEYFPLVDYVNANKERFGAADEMTRRKLIEEFFNE